jgi:hypothetical protein
MNNKLMFLTLCALIICAYSEKRVAVAENKRIEAFASCGRKPVITLECWPHEQCQILYISNGINGDYTCGIEDLRHKPKSVLEDK